MQILLLFFYSDKWKKNLEINTISLILELFKIKIFMSTVRNWNKERCLIKPFAV